MERDWINSLVHVAWDGNGILISGTRNGIINVWDLNTFECLQTIQVGEVTCLAKSDKGLIVGSRTGEILILDLKTLNCIRTLTGHTKEITCLEYSDGMVFSSSDDKTIRVWDLETGDPIKAFRGRVMINSLICLGNILISSCNSGAAEILDLKTGTCLKTFERVEGLNAGFPPSFHYANGILYANIRDHTITTWDFNHINASPLKEIAGTPYKAWELPMQPQAIDSLPERLLELSIRKEKKTIEQLYDTLRSSSRGLLTVSDYLRLLGIENCTEALTVSDTFITTTCGLNTYSDITPLGIDGRNLRLIRDIQAALPSIDQITVEDTGRLRKEVVEANKKVSALNEQIERLLEVEELLQMRCLLLEKCGLTSFDFKKEIETLSASLAQTEEGLKILLGSTPKMQTEFVKQQDGVQNAVSAMGQWLESAITIEQRIQIRLLQTFLVTPLGPGESFEHICQARCDDVSGVFPEE